MVEKNKTLADKGIRKQITAEAFNKNLQKTDHFSTIFKGEKQIFIAE
jgi:hypothetical protein